MGKYVKGKLNSNQHGCFTAPRPKEELYDTKIDPYELNNLAGDERYTTLLQKMRTALAAWEKRTGDNVPELGELLLQRYVGGVLGQAADEDVGPSES